jgi:hypothetical protein
MSAPPSALVRPASFKSESGSSKSPK